MTKAKSRSVAVQRDREDRISDLPRYLIDHILEFLPTQDAARTCILSSRWRYIWAKSPCVVLDKLFCNKFAVKSQSVFKQKVDEILLQHIGDISKFVLDISGEHFSSDIHTDIDRWMRYVSCNGIKQLTLIMFDNNIYKLPSYIFNCPALTHLKLSNCIFKPPNSFLGYPKLISLHLENIIFLPTTQSRVINVPALANLTVMHCDGSQFLNIVSPQLKTLTVHESHCHLELHCFTNCVKLSSLYLWVDNPVHGKRSTLEKLLFISPTLKVLTLTSYVLEHLSAGSVSEWRPVTLNCLWYLRLSVDFGKLHQATYALMLIKSSPNLRKLEISVKSTSKNTEAAKDKDTEGVLNLNLSCSKLKVVVIHMFKGSVIELLFVKYLLAGAPSLSRMSIKHEIAFGSTKERKTTTELMRYPRASPMAELFYLPYSV